MRTFVNRARDLECLFIFGAKQENNLHPVWAQSDRDRDLWKVFAPVNNSIHEERQNRLFSSVLERLESSEDVEAANQ